jgi:hypothetical protein
MRLSSLSSCPLVKSLPQDVAVEESVVAASWPRPREAGATEASLPQQDCHVAIDGAPLSPPPCCSISKQHTSRGRPLLTRQGEQLMTSVLLQKSYVQACR